MEKIKIKNIAALKAMIGEQLPPGNWITITQEMINDFAKATLDFQWIHVDIERAKKESPFGAPIAHGFMSVSMLSHLIENMILVESGKMGVNYGLNKVRFPQAVPAESKLRLNMTIANVEDYGDNGAKIFWDCIVEIEGKDKPACVGQFISLLFE